MEAVVGLTSCLQWESHQSDQYGSCVYFNPTAERKAGWHSATDVAQAQSLRPLELFVFFFAADFKKNPKAS